jgi:hypothetical protein
VSGVFFCFLCSISLLSLPRLRLAREPGCASCLAVALGQPLAGVDQLEDVEDLLKGHDWEAHAGDNPRYGRVHLVRARQLQSSGAVWVQEDGCRWRGSRCARLEAAGTLGSGDLQQRGRKVG